MRLADEPDIPPQINIVPMIDVVFAILTFFIISSLFLSRSESLPVNLPQAATAQSSPPAKVTITVDPQGKIALNRQPISLNQLEASIRENMEPNKDLMVILNADEAVNHGHVVKVMDQIRRIKGIKFAIAAKKQ